MTDAQWSALIDKVELQFAILERDKSESEEGGQIEWIAFSCPMGDVKLVRTVRPRVIGEAATYSKRIGANIAVRKVYDQHDKVSFLKAYLWDEAGDDWKELKNADATAFV